MITETLSAIQNELKAPKNQFNKFGGYNYRNCEDILEALKPILAKHKAINLLTDEVVQIGNRYYIKATATLQVGDEKISVDAYAREEESKKGMDSSQLTGSTSSYARKYALNGLYAIDDNKDADAQLSENLNNHTEKTTNKNSNVQSAGNQVTPDAEKQTLVDAINSQIKKIHDITGMQPEFIKKTAQANTKCEGKPVEEIRKINQYVDEWAKAAEQDNKS